MEENKLKFFNKKRAIALVLAGSIMFSAVTVMATELEQIEAKQGEIQGANELIQNQRYQIEQANQDLNYAFDSLEKLNEEAKALKDEIDALQAEIDRLEKSIADNEKKKQELEVKLEGQIDLFKKRLAIMYKNRNSGYISVLLSSDNVDDFLSKLTTMKSVAEYDKKLIEDMKDTKKLLDKVSISLKGEKATRDEAMANYKVKEAQLMDKINDQRDLIAIIQNNKDLAANEINRLEGIVSNLNSEIADLQTQLKERLEREEAERKAAEEAERARAAEAEAERLRLAAAESTTEALVNETAGLSSIDTSSRNYVPETNFKPFDGNIVYYNQREEPWGSASYGNGWLGTIAANGCGPTSMAMVLSSMTDTTVSPIEMANFATNNGHVMPGDGGSYWSLFPGAASAYGLSCVQTSNRAQIIEALSNGALVIASQNNALGNYWTYGGHFIVLTGITSSGNITVADPWSRGHSAVSHTQDQVFIPMRSAWIINK